MDAFADLFRGVRARGSLFGSAALTRPWALHFVDGAPLTLCSLLRGEGWIVPEGHPPERLHAGGTVIVRGPGTFTFVDDPDTRAEPIPCGEECTGPEVGGTRHRRGWSGCALPGGAGPGEAATLVVGAYPVRGEMSLRLLQALPVVLRVASGGGADAVLEHLAAEAAADTPGQQVVLDRLLDWLLVCAVREYFDRPGGEPPAWYAAQRDPVIGEVLRLLHAEPAASWTIRGLARRAGVARSTLAKRFTDLIGEPPLTYLTGLRMTLAADLLVEHESMTIAHVARSVGYSDAFAFSAAFKRVRGLSPSAHRRKGAGPPRGAHGSPEQPAGGSPPGADLHAPH